jgi:hypothetical protein
MKYIIYILFSQILFLQSFAQGNLDKYDIKVEFKAEPSIANSDGNITLSYNSVSENNYKFKILARISRNNKGKSDQYAELTWIRLKYLTNGNTYIIGDDLILPFVSDGLNQSAYVEHMIEIPSNIQSDGQIIGEYYTRDKFTSPIKETKTINTPLYTKIMSGPSQICSEAVFSLGGPEAVILENASGIANLTSLGNNKWKVTRIGANTGEIQMVSTAANKSFSKKIRVGNLPPRISGTQTVTSNNTYYYTVYKTDPNSTLSIDAYAGPGMPYTLNVVGNQIILNTQSIGGNVKDYYIQLRATETNSCGTSNPTVFSVRFRGGDGPIN